jgi:2,3,4,5-tetrahydropyridine-2,6-dicarboxylate N-succinyltransferase
MNQTQSHFSSSSLNSLTTQEVLDIIENLNCGKVRVAEKQDSGEWVTNPLVKQAILEYFKLQKIEPIYSGDLQFLDKIPLKKFETSSGVRVVPPALARYGSFISKGVILMPSFVNIGAFIDEGTMIDTWATVGSCAQIGKYVHLSGGVGIGGVLEPLQASPVIIEDYAFIGSRCIVVEGALIEQGAVLGAGVTITGSTKIIDVTKKEEVIYQGRVPAQSVVVPGTYQKSFPAGSYGASCALIIGQRKESTDKKTSLNETLREYGVSV